MERSKLYLSTIDQRAGDLARKCGLGVEIAAYCTAWNMDDKFCQMDSQVRRDIAQVPRRILHGPYNELHPCAIDPKARELAALRYGQAVALARNYQCSKVVIHGGYVPNVYYPCWYTRQSIDFWLDFMQQVPDTVQIVLENVLEEEPEMLLEIVQGVNDPRLRLCLDVGHANVYSKVPPLTWLDTLGAWITHFHIHNNSGSRDSHNALDQGNIPIKEILDRSARLCPGASYTLEITDAEPSVGMLLEECL